MLREWFGVHTFTCPSIILEYRTVFGEMSTTRVCNTNRAADGTHGHFYKAAGVFKTHTGVCAGGEEAAFAKSLLEGASLAEEDEKGVAAIVQAMLRHVQVTQTTGRRVYVKAGKGDGGAGGKECAFDCESCTE
jgi:hypothetical protein